MHLALVGYGYLGMEIARQVAKNPHISRLTILTRHLPESLDSSLGDVHECDISYRDALARLPEIEPDWIVHCASSSRGGADAYRAVYANGCQNLQGKFPASRVLFCSSSSVYSQTDGSWVTENSPTIPTRETGEILLETEKFVLAHGGGVARLAGIYGPNRSVLLRKFLENQAVIEENGERWLNQIHRNDAAAAILHLIQNAPQTDPFLYNICDSQPLSQRECYEFLAQHFQREIPPLGPRDLNRKRGWTHKRVSNQKLLSSGWAPHYPCFFDALPTLRDSSSASGDA